MSVSVNGVVGVVCSPLLVLKKFFSTEATKLAAGWLTQQKCYSSWFHKPAFFVRRSQTFPATPIFFIKLAIICSFVSSPSFCTIPEHLSLHVSEGLLIVMCMKKMHWLQFKDVTEFFCFVLYKVLWFSLAGSKTSLSFLLDTRKASVCFARTEASVSFKHLKRCTLTFLQRRNWGSGCCWMLWCALHVKHTEAFSSELKWKVWW